MNNNTDNMQEIWKAIPNHPTFYVSNLGRVKRDWITNTYGIHRVEIRTPIKNNKNHYQVSLIKHKELIHRLVAEAFVPNPNNYPIVHHIDEDPTNNRADNLVWVTDEEHKLHHRGKKIYCAETDTVYPSYRAASKELGISDNYISQCMRKNKQVCCGYHIQMVE